MSNTDICFGKIIFLSIIDATWCVCRSGLNDTALQKTIDYACGHGADCTPILQNGACYNPNNVKAHCSYAANSYYQRKNEDGASCDFGGTAVTTSTDPSKFLFHKSQNDTGFS
jgi:X8 domain